MDRTLSRQSAQHISQVALFAALLAVLGLIPKIDLPFGVPITVSLNTIMIDGTGMCGGCRVSVGGETKFVCVDGPEFDGYKVDFDNMMTRMGAFRSREQEEYHKCRVGLDAKAGA